jgi:hypothetical protein
MRLFPYLFLVGIAVMTSCGVPDGPVAQEATATVGVEEASPIVEPSVGVAASVTPLGEPTALPAGDTQLDASPTSVAPGADIDIPLAFTPAPGLPVLRDLLPQAEGLRTRTSTMIYSQSSTDPDKVFVSEFWAVDMDQPDKPRKLFEVTLNRIPRFGVFGKLSPDGQYIAYLDELGSGDGAELKLVGIDGTDQRLIMRGLSSAASFWLHQFDWSPDSTKLVFKHPWEQGQSFYIYNLISNEPPKEVTRVGGASLGGWIDNNQFLISMVTNPEEPLQITAVDIMTGQREPLAPFPGGQSFGMQMSPDRTKVRMTKYIFDVSTRTFTLVDSARGFTAWASDSRALILTPQFTTDASLLIDTTNQNNPTRIALFPDAQTLTFFDLAAYSNDGRYIFGKGGYQSPAGKKTDLALVYDVLQNRWVRIGQIPYITVSGWVTH